MSTTAPLQKSLWEHFSSLGIKPELNNEIRKKIVLTNQLSILIFVFINISLVIFGFFHTDKELILLLGALNLLPVITYVMNSMGFINPVDYFFQSLHR
ncbi:MAG: hypothetical protein EA412_12750 [Chitinophagaceae bacterium]|nr:MAG: hypothetical protein EA412_12750 [Chitinophagaceae bacterium]